MKGAVRFLAYSLLGLFFFFMPLTIGTTNTIPVDHMINWLKASFPSVCRWYILAVMWVGALWPFVRRSWRSDGLTAFFSLAKVAGALFGTVYVFGLFNGEPFMAWFWNADTGPFLFEKLALTVGLVIPLGSVFLSFLASFGLMEYTGELMTPVMRPLFRTPGRSAIDAVASFVGSYSIALLITNDMYRKSKYSAREAAIVATGFSTVSATFLLIVAKTLGLMPLWGTYFWVSLLVTFAVTALTARLYPLNRVPESFVGGTRDTEPVRSGGLFSRAWQAGVETAAAQEPLVNLVRDNFTAGLRMALTVIPSIMGVGLLGLVLAQHTPLFEWFGLIFVPFFKIFGTGEALLAGKAAALSLPEMFLPATAVVNAGMPVKFTIAVVSVSEILFFSASIPCMLGTDIPLRLRDLLIVWFERVALSILITMPIALWLFG